ncbi:MAG: FmdB family zinc ribbon protein [Halanaerobiaceae bacterium]
MPTYLYECEECGRFEEFQKITDEPLTECPECSSNVKRVIGGAPGIIFKGSGFYSTDNREGSKVNKDAEKPSAADDKSVDSSAGKDGTAGSSKEEKVS